MKSYFVLTAILCIFLLLFPLSVVSASKSSRENSEKTSAVSQSDEEQENETKNKTAVKTVKVLRTSSGKVVQMNMKDYLIGAVSSEISPFYEEEAIKAQAVACYTYAKWLMLNADRSQIDGADISDSPETHQGYYDEDELKERWGDKYESYKQKIESCVSSVLGKYMTYNNEPIIACYHSLSSGKTEDALTVWGKDIEYLKSVSAPGDKLSPDYDSSVTLTEEEFSQKCKSLGDLSLPKKASDWVKDLKTSKNGFVTSVKIGSKTFDGNDIRSAFSLKSPYFTVKYEDAKFTFSVVGYGHGLGMSQYSADYMARQGSSYEEILKHFYTGIEIQSDDLS
ncbi:MAG: stage II sporulation protein D [Acutalibacteraceae bacterium]